MAYTAPFTAVTGAVILASDWNTSGRDDILFLKDRIDNPPRCKLTHSTTQSIANSTTTALTWDTETEDGAGIHSTVTNPTRITIPSGQDGWWVFSTYLEFASNATGERRVALYRNGSLVYEDRRTPISGSVTRMAITFPEYAAVAGDYFEIQVTQNSGGALNIAASPIFVARRTV